ncbi:hypothetical protein ACLOAU_21480 [Niabella sp. CJ426]|uniref:hypothetical protein n=1 Tax=Niabella sp. CJ426 TaxID=3393740 RepID=UPI003CFED3C9
MLFVDYTNQVLQDYQKKLAAGKLPSNLSQPTPARLRDECLIVFKDRFTKKDERTLRDFFGPPGENGYEWVIENWNIGKLKAMINFLNNPAIKTDEKNIELLAWLIDFEPRPLEQWKKNGGQPIAISVNEEIEIDQESPPEKVEEDKSVEDLKAPQPAPGPTPAPPKEEPPLIPVLLASPKTPVKKTALGGLIAAILLSVTGILVFNGNNSSGGGILLGGGLSNQCMYWAGDHYEPLPCDQKIDDVAVIPVDTVRLRRFKKITRPDTITINDIGRVWYAKINRQLEFYTFEGTHPTKPQLRLKPITGYIIDKYIQNSHPAE